jgi:hypothetical protein
LKADLDNEGIIVSKDCFTFFLYICYMRWTGYVARVGETKGAYRVLVGKPGARDHFEDPGVHERIILKLIFWK